MTKTTQNSARVCWGEKSGGVKRVLGWEVGDSVGSLRVLGGPWSDGGQGGCRARFLGTRPVAKTLAASFISLMLKTIIPLIQTANPGE